MQQFRKDPNFKGILSEIDYLHPYYSIFVEDRKLLREVFMEGRAEPDSFYNQPNEMSVFEEGLVRNLVYGQLYHGNVLGRRCIVYSPGDVFGHPAQLSQLAAKGGCIGLAWDKYILGLPPLFRHVSPDGSALVHRRGRVTRYEARMMGFSSSIGVADKGAPSDWLNHLVPVKKLAVPSEFHDAIIGEEKAIIASKKGKKPIPLTSRDISLYHAGTALSRIDLKIADRLGESLLISAEKFATIASLLGANYPERALDKAWRQLLCGQHHDSITGTHNEISYVDLMIAYRESVEIASEVLNRSLSFLSEAIEVKCNKDEIPIHVYNPHSWRRKDVCFVNLNLSKKLSEYELRDIKGQKCEMQLVSEDVKGDSYHYCVAFLAEVPPLGYTTYYLTPSMNTIKKALRLEDKYTIENEYYRIQVDPEQGGGIVSIYDKEEGREILDTSKDGPGNRICVLKEYPDRNEAQHEFYTTGLKAFSSEYKAKVSVEKGPVMEKIIVEGHIGTICETRQEITLFKGVKRIDFKTFIIDYEDEDDLFVVTFPSNLKGVVPTFDERYAAVVKTKSKGKLDFRTHQMFMFSGCAVYSANRWIDYGPSVKFVIQDGGQTISEHSIGMVALIRPEEPEMVEAADKFLIALTKKGLHVTQWPDGEQEQIGSLIKHFNEDLLNTDTRIVLTTTRLENKYAAELIGRLSEREREQFFTAVEEKGSSTLFMVDRDNLWGKPIDVVIIAGASIDHLQKRLNRMEVELANNETIILDDCIFKAEKGIVDNYGISLINTGNIACSVEQGGILTLMLFHTAKWYGGTGNITEEYFVPERKTHVFRYSLYPHAGTWRDAKTYQKSFEVNDPLIAIQGNAKRRGAGILPECKSFLQTSDDIVVTAVKAYGNPMASFQKNIGNVEDRGITIRFYEPRGKTAIGHLKFGFDVDRFARTNLLEEKEKESRVEGNEIRWPIGPFSVETIYIHPMVSDKKMPAKDLGPWKEPVEPVYVRSWEHDAGTLPFGYNTVVASISRQVDVYPDERDIGLTLNVVNNYIDSQVSGKLRLLVPEGWKVSQSEFEYTLTAQDYASFKVKIRKPSVAAQGQVRLLYEHEGQIFEDILEIGGMITPEFIMKKTEEGIVGIIKNPSKELIEGELAIASPIETWPKSVVGDFSMVDIYPRTCKVSVPAGETKEFLFEVNPHTTPEVHTSWWAVGKLMLNGRIYMKAVKEPGKNRKWRARTMRNIIEAENGSLVPYLSLMLS